MATVQQLLETKGHNVASIGPDETVYEAVRQLAERNIGALLVLDDGKLCGIISERDYARSVILRGRSSSDTLVKDIMSRRVVCARPDQTVEECMAVMTENSIRHLPVLDQKEVVGVISIGDLVKSVIRDQQFTIEQLQSYIHG